MKVAEFDTAHFRRILGHFPTGVVVIAAIDCGEPVGMTMGSFTSVSLDPPMVGFFPGKSSTSWPRIAQAGRFVVNILAAHQVDLCRAFAARGADKFASCTWRSADNGAPVINGAIAWIECSISQVFDVGDHWFVLGDVASLTADGGSDPLVFFRGQYKGLQPQPE